MATREKSGERLTPSQARLLHLAAQGLLAPSRRRARKTDLLAAIVNMRLLQIDTIHIVARSPYLVLFSRIGAYRQEWLDQLLEAGAIFECWAHEACFAPMADHALHRAELATRSHHWAARRALATRHEHSSEMERLLAHIRETGAVKSADFSCAPRDTASGWWGWKAEKRWLEAWFALGDLMIARRENFHRVYDLAERVIARARVNGFLPDSALPIDAAAVRRRFTLDAVRALGITPASWIADYFRMRPAVTDAELESLVAGGELRCTTVDGWDDVAYVHRDHDALAQRAQAGKLRATHTTLLSPFDPLVWDRVRASSMFDFDYRLECYTPAPKRRWGYYVLPILHRGRLIGRLDAKAHRADGVFEIMRIFLEPGLRTSDRMAGDVARALRACAEWHATPRISIRRSDPPGFARALRGALAS
ncbi:MAG: crosslink repair DNA glycosylase YcaQ family protein [Rhodanobacteraceae bacterium]